MDSRDTRTDAALLKASGRDPAAFGVFYTRHAHDVSAFFSVRAGDRALVADLTAETFAQAFANRRRLTDIGAPATAWLYSIARRQLSEYYRTERVAAKYRHKLRIENHDNTASIDRIDEIDAVRRLYPDVDQLLGTLTDAAAQAIRLRVIDGLAYAEVAGALGCSPGAARVRVSRALDTLQEHLTRGDSTVPADPSPSTHTPTPAETCTGDFAS